jgi:two-component system chemotaxis response regulator CheB
MQRDIVAIGTSAGGVETLPTLLSQLPADTAAAFLIVLHLGASNTGHLAAILQRACTLNVQWAGDEMPIERGTVYVAVPDRHMQILDGRIVLVPGARENHARPSINRLFRSAAAIHGARTIGVLLTGMLDDGVLGLGSIQRAGGVTIVQDPKDALYPDMPHAALEVMTPDHVLPVSRMGAALRELIGVQVVEVPTPPDLALHAQLDGNGPSTPADLDQLGPLTELICPDCGGPMWDVGYGRVRGYRCYMGHGSGPRTLLAGQANEIERSLWIAIRALQERATTYADLSRGAHKAGSAQAAALYEQQAEEAREHAERARQFLLAWQRA